MKITHKIAAVLAGVALLVALGSGEPIKVKEFSEKLNEALEFAEKPLGRAPNAGQMP